MTLLVAIVVAIAASAGQILLKAGAAKHPGLAAFISEPLIWYGMAVYAVCAIIWLWVLSKMQVSTAYPVLSLSFVFVPLIARFTLGERITPSHWLGIALICIGVLVLYSGSEVFRSWSE
jgi:drug/metabolite transporter (DMT)-like permease